jgi:hypothetical protein
MTIMVLTFKDGEQNRIPRRALELTFTGKRLIG